MVATAVKRRRGTTLEHKTFTGLPAEITIDTDKNVVVVHDGTTPGGTPMMKQSDVENIATKISTTIATDISQTTATEISKETVDARGTYITLADSVSILEFGLSSDCVPGQWYISGTNNTDTPDSSDGWKFLFIFDSTTVKNIYGYKVETGQFFIIEYNSVTSTWSEWTALTDNRLDEFFPNGMLGLEHIPESLGRLDGILFARNVDDKTIVPASSIPANIVVKERYTQLRDADATLATATRKIDNNNWEFTTLSFSPIGIREAIPLGNIPDRTTLPMNDTDCFTLFGMYANIGDWIIITTDENHSGKTVEIYLQNKNEDGTGYVWGGDRVLNTSDYQAQSTLSDSGKILTGGATAGTFGPSLGLDVSPTKDSKNLLNSGVIYNKFNSYKTAINIPDNVDVLAFFQNNALPGQLYYGYASRGHTGLPLANIDTWGFYLDNVDSNIKNLWAYNPINGDVYYTHKTVSGWSAWSKANSNYQEKTTTAMSGRILLGTSEAGKFSSRPIDTILSSTSNGIPDNKTVYSGIYSLSNTPIVISGDFDFNSTQAMTPGFYRLGGGIFTNGPIVNGTTSIGGCYLRVIKANETNDRYFQELFIWNTNERFSGVYCTRGRQDGIWGPWRIHLGAGYITEESDPIYMADKPNIAFKTDVTNSISAHNNSSTTHTDLRNLISANTSKIGTLDTSVNTIQGKIPTQASVTNQLADKAFVNSSISNLAANRVTYDAAGNAFPTKQALTNAISSGIFYHQGIRYTPTNHDYLLVEVDSSAPEPFTNGQTRYEYDGTQWNYAYGLNNRPFTAAETAAIESGITSDLVSKIGLLDNPGYQTKTITSMTGRILVGGTTAGTFGTARAIETSLSTTSTGILDNKTVTTALNSKQAASTTAMSGSVLIGGSTAGTFGTARAIDTTPVNGSNNLITSGGVYSGFYNFNSTLKPPRNTDIFTFFASTVASSKPLMGQWYQCRTDYGHTNLPPGGDIFNIYGVSQDNSGRANYLYANNVSSGVQWYTLGGPTTTGGFDAWRQVGGDSGGGSDYTIDYTRVAQISTPTATAKYTMPWDGYVVVRTTTPPGQYADAFFGSGSGITFIHTQWDGTTGTLVDCSFSPLLRKGTPVWTAGSIAYVYSAPAWYVFN